MAQQIEYIPPRVSIEMLLTTWQEYCRAAIAGQLEPEDRIVFRETIRLIQNPPIRVSVVNGDH